MTSQRTSFQKLLINQVFSSTDFPPQHVMTRAGKDVALSDYHGSGREVQRD